MPDLTEYDVILLNTSGGKDSQVMIDEVYQLAAAADVTSKLVAVHCDLGRVEWAGTKELAERQVRIYGIPFEVVSRPQGDLLVQIEQRGMWPSNTARYCTSDHKRGQVYRLLTKLTAERWVKGGPAVRILNCMGLRAEESPARAKKIAFYHDPKASNGKRWVDQWLPVHHWKLGEVWDRIHKTGVPYHYAYDLGMPRLSCCFCIFAPRPALIIAGHHNRELLKDYARVEIKMNHKFRKDQPIVEILAAVEAGEQADAAKIVWKQCA
jgi:3'-phosphoadenosine 5'-phosphosulfate sulfotransferase (PAPS reductase)/FAD synthetase